MTTETTPSSAQVSSYRTHRIGELSNRDAGSTVRLAGWVHRKRLLGSLAFLELRDATGIVQCVLEQGTPPFDGIHQLSLESVVSVAGTLVLRAEQARNPRLASGDLELRAGALDVLSTAAPLPFPIQEETAVPEELRLRHRYLDLRRARIRRNVLLRARVISRLRGLMQARGFVEFQTPILTASSPEGARDFLVPSRVHPHRCYALPQAPQQFKQLLMVAGFERYFQIAPCFRDEDARADRSPGEFYQLDIEITFAGQDEIFATIEPVLHSVLAELGQKRVAAPPFPRITWRDALERYASDKPDLRNPLTFSSVPAALADALAGGGLAAASPWRALRMPRGARLPRRFFDERANAPRAAARAADDVDGRGAVTCPGNRGTDAMRAPRAPRLPSSSEKHVGGGPGLALDADPTRADAGGRACRRLPRPARRQRPRRLLFLGGRAAAGRRWAAPRGPARRRA